MQFWYKENLKMNKEEIIDRLKQLEDALTDIIQDIKDGELE